MKDDFIDSDLSEEEMGDVAELDEDEMEDDMMDGDEDSDEEKDAY